MLLEVRKSINVDCLISFERQLRFEFELNLSSGHVSRLHKRGVNDLKLMAIWGCLKSVAQYSRSLIRSNVADSNVKPSCESVFKLVKLASSI